MTPQTKQQLTKLLRDTRTHSTGSSADDRGFYAAGYISALKEAGLLTEDEMDKWLERALEVANKE